MSICRFQPFADAGPQSDVYVYEDRDGWVCCGCRLGQVSLSVSEPAQMIAHMREHVAAGHKVPAHALEAESYEWSGLHRGSRYRGYPNREGGMSGIVDWNGVMAARNAWHSISPAQRRLMELLPGRTLWMSRHNGNLYEATGEPHAIARAAGAPTVRNLVRRGLLECVDGWRKVTLSERGRFVLAHGRPSSEGRAE